ncbi:uncharacterized protein LOC103317516 isoform X2 [Nasonia vitripennis]|uniref:Uncharacterized protein n=1 Tax=Nasonia vitripennis TaxID=7425 RepID=A0A7M7HAM6_NASVI|nr:uncharacterized protein LOC103317516 isoform X2 [Nasonia vitripennis]
MQPLKFLVSPGNSKFITGRNRQTGLRLLGSQCNVAQSGEKSEDCKIVPCWSERNAADAYERELTQVRKKAIDLQILTKNSCKSLLDSMNAVDNEPSPELRQLDLEIERKIREISSMSLVCGARKRLESYALAEKVAANLQVWLCGNAAGVRCVECRLGELECRIRERTDTAVEMVRTCRGCVSSQALLSCLGDASAAAARLLETGEEHVKSEVDNVEQLCDRFRLENAKERERVTSPLVSELASFDRDLDSCIEELDSATDRRRKR